jgi:F0F1-type ATP synthase alpha subunit
MKKKLSEVFVLNDDEKVKPISDFLEKEIEIDLKDFRPADRFNEISKERDEYKQKLEERGKELDQLKQNAGDNTALKKQIEEMQETNKKQLEELTNQSKQKETEWETKLKTEQNYARNNYTRINAT